MKILKKNKWLLIIACFCYVFFAFFYFGVWNNSISQSEINQFQYKYSSLEKLADKNLEYLLSKRNYDQELFIELDSNSFFKKFLYKEDSLIFWSSNTISIPTFWNGEVGSGVYFIGNGWYDVRSLKKGVYKAIVMFPIKKKYPYQNQILKNDFLPVYDFPYNSKISLDDENGYRINSKDGDFRFFLSTGKVKNTSQNMEFFAFVSYLISVLILFYISLKELALRSKKWYSILFFGSVFVICIQLANLYYDGFHFFNGFEIFKTKLYTSSWLMPNLGYSITNIFLLFFISLLSYDLVKNNLKKNYKIGFVFYILLSYLILLLLGFFITYVIKSFIIDSSIPLNLMKLFSLNFYSFVLIVLVFILFFSYFLLSRTIFKLLVSQKLISRKLFVFIFLSFLFYIVIYFYFGYNSVFGFVWLFLVNLIIFYIEYFQAGNYSFTVALILLLIFCGFGSTSITNYFQEKELDSRRIFAEKLYSEKDNEIELNYDRIKDKLKSSKVLQKLLKNPYSFPKSEFSQKILEEVFYDGWEKYEQIFFVFDLDSIPMINYRSAKGSDFKSLDEIIKRHTKETDISEGIYFVTDYFDKLSYVIKQPIYDKDSINGYVFSLLKSKKIPDEIGFPSLLINNEDKIISNVEKYSMARYVKGNLLRRYGTYNYPMETDRWMIEFGNNIQVFEADFDHFIINDEEQNIVILTKPRISTLDFITAFSYLFAIFGFLLLIPLFIFNYERGFSLQRLNLTTKIQFVLLFFILVALIAFGFGSGLFIKNQYFTNSKDFIREKIGSVQTEVKQKLGNEESLENEDLESYLEYILSKFSKVFVTDINLYSINGKLLASSRPEIYNKGLIGELINKEAFVSMNLKKSSEYIHQENIGNLSYLSAYQPFINKEGKLLAYLNLQYFAQQNSLENQISEFLVSIINVFILLLVVSIVLGIFITSWLTRPLKLIQKNISSIELGKLNEPIKYSGNDEIGSLVEVYNKKVTELEENAKQLAKSERESAWREMAKQVAHEIKNPLTPMKLSMQHFERTFDPTDKNSKQKLEQLSHSIIEQIDGLTKIANEFSNFAKMPKAKEEKIDLNEILNICIELFKKSQNCELIKIGKLKKAIVIADKNLLIRVFNNLLKNAVQSIPKNRPGKIEVEIKQLTQFIQVSVKDNGIGIAKNQMDKIFVPNFTTKSNGTGLGLAMVKQIVEHAKGKVKFDSQIDVGSVFYVTLPIENKIK